MVPVVVLLLGLFLLLAGSLSAGGAEARGRAGERIVSRILADALGGSRDRVLNDLLVPDGLGGTTQIDHVALTPGGIFVVETKNMQGWIFGDGRSESWTQVIYREKHRFMNPCRQNYKHLMCLARLARVPASRLISVVVFIGDCTLKTRSKLPEHVLAGPRELREFIGRTRDRVFSDRDLAAIRRRILAASLSDDGRNHRRHVEHVRMIVERKHRRG